MDQHRAVSKKMLSVKMEGILPDIYFSYIRSCFMEMYAAGYDYGRTSINYKQDKPIAQIYAKTGKVINVFKSRLEASRITGYKLISIRRAQANEKSFRGYIWQWITKNDYENFNNRLE